VRRKLYACRAQKTRVHANNKGAPNEYVKIWSFTVTQIEVDHPPMSISTKAAIIEDALKLSRAARGTRTLWKCNIKERTVVIRNSLRERNPSDGRYKSAMSYLEKKTFIWSLERTSSSLDEAYVTIGKTAGTRMLCMNSEALHQRYSTRVTRIGIS
jgi:hypothetical protein